MILSALSDYNFRTLDYIERYINDGSPSGFTLHDQLSIKTNPLGLEPFFYPYKLETEEEQTTHHSTFFDRLDKYPNILVHPDAIYHLKDKGLNFKKTETRLVPTSSGRTSRFLDDKDGYYIKMHIPKILGRIDRSLPEYKGLAGVEISDEIARALDKHRLDKDLAILPEIKVVSVNVSYSKNFCHVIRAASPYPVFDQNTIKIPLFALWSIDRLSPLDNTLLEQIYHKDITIFYNLILGICSSTINIFFDLWAHIGLIYEANAQNLLIGLSSDFTYKYTILRDFTSTEKDHAQRKKIGLGNNFRSSTYKIINSDTDPDFAQKRRSFCFDFKLSHYVIRPLIKASQRLNQNLSDDILYHLKENTKKKLHDLPPDFFPRGFWWSHPDMLLNNDRPYKKNSSPYLRS